jgi:hypothetical protein
MTIQVTRDGLKFTEPTAEEQATWERIRRSIIASERELIIDRLTDLKGNAKHVTLDVQAIINWLRKGDL